MGPPKIVPSVDSVCIKPPPEKPSPHESSTTKLKIVPSTLGSIGPTATLKVPPDAPPLPLATWLPVKLLVTYQDISVGKEP